jgi:NAD(P)-dependent dehydrogenase (short-subunit alcohol dehydrogenase family)
MAARPSPTKNFHRTTYPSLDPSRPELSAKGKTIIITGGGSGIGAETAVYFAKAGASRIGILGRREQPLLETKARIQAEFPNAEIFAIPTDITKQSEVESAFAKVAGKGQINVLISNAAVIGAQGYVADMTAEEFLSGIVINLQSNFNVTKAFLKYAPEEAVIVETNSAAAHLTIGPKFSSYNVAKAATARLYSSLAFEHPSISIFSIHPGSINTAMSKEAGFEPKQEGKEQKWKGEGSSLLLGYDDANLPASFIVWLASPEARFLKGRFLWANWDVDELKSKAKEIENGSFLNIGLIGWPFA